MLGKATVSYLKSGIGIIDLLMMDSMQILKASA